MCRVRIAKYTNANEKCISRYKISTNRIRITLFLTSVFIMQFATTTISSVYPYYIIKLRLKMEIYGTIGTLANLVSVFLRLFFSSYIPSLGYFKSYIIGSLPLLLSRIFYTLSSINILTYALFFLGYFSSTTGLSLYMITRSSIMAKISSKARRGLALGGAASIGMLASSIAPFIGSYIYLLTNNCFTLVFLFSAILVILSMILAIPLLINDIKEVSQKESFLLHLKNICRILRYSKLRRCFYVFMFDAFSWSISFLYTSIYLAKEIGASTVDLAILNLITNIVSILGFILAGYISDKLRKRKIFLFLSEIFGLIYFGTFILARDLTPFFIGYAMLGFTISLWDPIAIAYITEKSEEISSEIIPIAIGVNSFLTGLARTPGSIIGGFLYDISPKLLFEVVFLLVLIASILILIFIEE